MGIQWWYLPQISIHWPKNIPALQKHIILCEQNPGIQSILIPADGIAQEWIMSFDVVTKCIRTPTGIAITFCVIDLYKLLKPLLIGIYGFVKLFE